MSSLGPSGLRRLALVAIVVGFVVAVGAGTAAAEPEIDDFEFDADDELAGAIAEYEVGGDVANVSENENLVFELDVTEWTESENGEFIDIVDTGDFDDADASGGVITFTKTADGENVSPVATISLRNPTIDEATATLTVHSGEGTSEPATETVEFGEIAASFADDPVDSIGPDDETTLSVEADGSPAEHVVVSSPGLDGNQLESIFSVDRDHEDIGVETDGDRLLINRPADAGEQPPVPEIEASFTHVGAANYQFVISVDRSREETVIPLEVEEPDIDVEFDEDLYEVPAGDLVTMDVSLDGLDETYLLVGADGTTAEEGVNDFLDIVKFDGGELTVNTRLLGTDAPTDAVYITDGTVHSYLHGDEAEFDDVDFREDEEGEGDEIAASLDEYRDELDMTEQPRPLQPDRYRIVAGAEGTVITRDDEIPDFDYPLGRSNLLLNQPEPGEVTTHVAPQASANSIEETGSLNELVEELTERETVAKGDRLVFEIEATGIYGNLFAFGDGSEPPFEEGVHPRALGSVVDAHEGIIVNVSETNSDPNTAPTEIDFNEPADGDAYVLPAHEDEELSEIDRFYVVLDTRDSGPFTRSVRHGDEFDVEFGYESPSDARHRFVDVPLGVRPPAYSIDPDLVDENPNTEHYPYYRTSETGETNVAPFRIEDPSAEYDRTTVADELLVHNGTNVTVTGTTNVAPGTDTHIQLIAHNRTNPTRITIDEVEIDEDGSFSATEDLSTLRVGEDVEAEFYANQRLADKRAADVVDDLDDPSEFIVTDVGNPVTMTEGDNDTRVSATIENTGNAADRKPIEFVFEDAQIEETNRTVEPDEPAPFNFDVPDGLETGTYNYTVVTPDDEASGQVVVEPPEPEEVIAAGGDDPVDDPAEPVDDNLPADALGELVGALTSLVGARHAVGAAVIVGGAYVLGG